MKKQRRQKIERFVVRNTNTWQLLMVAPLAEFWLLNCQPQMNKTLALAILAHAIICHLVGMLLFTYSLWIKAIGIRRMAREIREHKRFRETMQKCNKRLDETVPENFDARKN